MGGQQLPTIRMPGNKDGCRRIGRCRKTGKEKTRRWKRRAQDTNHAAEHRRALNDCTTIWRWMRRTQDTTYTTLR